MESEGSVLKISAAIAVFKTHDVVFSEVLAALDLDQFHGDEAGVAEPVLAAERDVGALVFADQLLFAITLHKGGSMHYHPMFGSVMVHL